MVNPQDASCLSMTNKESYSVFVPQHYKVEEANHPIAETSILHALSF